MKNITLYVSDGCSGCHQVLPMLRKLTRKKGVKLTVVDVEKCGKPCDWVREVPIVKVDGKVKRDVYKVLRSLQ